MLFSVIIPVYNVEKYLNQCIGSILAQKFRDYELILVDDGSKDGSGSICDRYAAANSRVQVIHQINQGQACARNAGTKAAKGGYIVYLDSDDYISDENFLEILSGKCDGRTDIVFYGYRKYFENTGKYGPEVCEYPKISEETAPCRVIDMILKADMFDGCPWNKAIRRKFLEEHQIGFTPGLISEDSDWFMQVIMRAKKYDAVNRSFVIYRQRSGSISHDAKIKSLKDNVYILETWEKRFREAEVTEADRRVLMSVLARHYGNVLILYTVFPKEQSEPYFDRMKKLGYLLKYSVSKRAKLIGKAYRLLGQRATLRLLAVMKKIKGNN